VSGNVRRARRARRVDARRIEAALCTLADLTTEEHDELDDGGVRDEFSHVIDVLDRILERKAGGR